MYRLCDDIWVKFYKRIDPLPSEEHLSAGQIHNYKPLTILRGKIAYY